MIYILSIFICGLITLSKSDLVDFTGQWVAKCLECQETKYSITTGVTYGSSYSSVTEASKTMTASVSAGFEFLGIGTSIEMSGTIGKTVSDTVESDYKTSTTITVELTCTDDLYQFELSGDTINLQYSELLCSKSKPNCVPGQCISDGNGGFKMPDAKLINIYRFINEGNGDHITGSNMYEVINGITRESILFQLYDQQIDGTVPLYRLYREGSDIYKTDHMISLDPTEGYAVDYRYESILGFCKHTLSSPSVSTERAIYRQYNGVDHMTSLQSTAEQLDYTMIEFAGCYGWN